MKHTTASKTTGEEQDVHVVCVCKNYRYLLLKGLQQCYMY